METFKKAHNLGEIKDDEIGYSTNNINIKLKRSIDLLEKDCSSNDKGVFIMVYDMTDYDTI